MRLIIKEYIYQLKEKDELDILISEIFQQQGYIADTYPKTGNRQYGVDIQMHNDNELLLFVVKQGNIDRNVWNGGVNAVRQSIEEIKDVLINSLTYEELQKKIRIIVATNGQREESIKLNFNNYVNNNQMWNDIPVKIEFMGIDDIVKEILNSFFNEYLFERSLHSAMRKALYFVGEGDYKSGYYEQIVDSTVEKMKKAGNNRKKICKACSTLYLASQMICQYANDEGNTKIAIRVSEYVIIKYWKFLFESNMFEKEQYIEWLIKFCNCYERWSNIYVKKIQKIVDKQVILPNYNVVENRVLLYEILGYLATYANYLIEFSPDKARNILNVIIGILNEYTYYEYMPYDNNVGVMIMIYKILYHCKRIDEIKFLMKNQAQILMGYYRVYNKFPAPSDTFEEAVAIETSEGNEDYEVSAFWGYYLLLMAYLDCYELYESAKEFLQCDLEKVSKCVWFLRENEELNFYNAWAMNLAGEGVEISVTDEYKTFSDKVNFILEQYKDEKFSFDEYSFESLEILICHYYGYIPRITF